MLLGPATPILRTFDEDKAREFYVSFLGFGVDFEHRFETGLPLYMGISHGGCRIHLSEHHGDACPGAHVRIPVNGIRAWAADLGTKAYPFARVGDPEEKPWGTVELTITDPFGNRLTFFEAAR